MTRGKTKEVILEHQDLMQKLLRFQITYADMLEALEYIRLSRKSHDLGEINALIGMAVICYARPFSGNQGTGKKYNKLCLCDVLDEVADKDKELHRLVIALRDKVIAHSDGDHAQIIYTPLSKNSTEHIKGVMKTQSVLLDLRPKLNTLEELTLSIRKTVANKINIIEALIPELPYPVGGWT